MSLVLLLDSDTHFSHGQIRDDKKNNVKNMLKEPEGIVLLAGDITNGNAPTFWQWLTCSIPYDNCTQVFKRDYLQPLEKKHKVYFVAGNHDREAKFRNSPGWPDYMEIDELAIQKYGSVNYTVELSHNVLLVAFGDLYPTKETLEWFKSLNIDRERPLIMMWHYNTLSEPFADWWSDQEKEHFWNVIEPYNLLCIFNGHFHQSNYQRYNGVHMVKAASRGYVRFTIDVKTRKAKYRRVC